MAKDKYIIATYNGTRYVRSMASFAKLIGVTEHLMRKLYDEGLRGQKLIDKAASLSNKNHKPVAAQKAFLFGGSHG